LRNYISLELRIIRYKGYLPNVASVRKDDISTLNVGVLEAIGMLFGDEVEPGPVIDLETVKVLPTDHGYTARDKRLDLD
jgi:hypothetical protein